MLNVIVNVPDLGIENGKVTAESVNIGGYTMYNVQYRRDNSSEMKVIGVHKHEIEIVDDSNIIERSEAELDLGDEVKFKSPLNIPGIVNEIVYSVSGCTEYRITYESSVGITSKLTSAPLLDKIGIATEAGTQTGSMIRTEYTRT